jgi:quinoprotein glucose dehydrogenase
MRRPSKHRNSRRFLCVALSVSLFVVLIAAGWTEYSTTATAAGFALEIHGGVLPARARRGEGVAPRSDWTLNGSAGGTHYSSLDEVSRANVDSLRVAWTFRTGDVSDGEAADGGPATAFESTPLMLDGTLYIATPSAHVIALDPEVGTPRWTYDAHIDRVSLAHDEVTTRGLSAWVDSSRANEMPCRTRIFFATFDARLIALDGRSGVPCTDFGRAGTVDLRAGIRNAARLAHEYHVTSPPAVIDGLVIVGSSIFDNLHAEAPSGAVRAFDARTGSVRWSWEPLRDEPEDGATGMSQSRPFRSGAANAWGLFAVDAERDLVFIPTGSPSPDHFGGLRPGPNANANSIVALRGASGQLVWSFQLVHHDLWDYDAAAQPVLTTVVRDGRETAVVMQASKTGDIFVLDRDTGVPVFPIGERAVPRSDVAGEDAARTQPFSVTPAPVVPQGLRSSDAWGLTPFDRDWCARRIASLRSEGMFTPPSLRGTIEFPGFLGGVNWGGIGVDRPRGVAIMNTIRVATVVTLLAPDSIAEDSRRAGNDAAVARQEGAPYGSRRELLRSPIGLPCNAPPWGTLVAVDLDDGRVRWEIPFGTMSDVAHLPSPRSWGSPSLGGPLVTAGGLVFIAATMDHQLRAFDTENGKQVWETQLPASAQASPMSYRVRPDGRQFIVIAAGGHHLMRTKLGDYLIAYALP